MQSADSIFAKENHLLRKFLVGDKAAGDRKILRRRLKEFLLPAV
jgi:hypothetical protein